MKVVFLFGSLGRGGAERVIASLANDFVDQGIQVDIVSLNNQKPGYQLHDAVHVEGLDVAGDSKNVFQALRRNIKTIVVLRRYLKTTKPDRVVVFAMRLAVQVILAVPFRRSFRIIVSERANPKFARAGAFERVLENWLLPKADTFIFQTDRVQQYFSQAVRKKGVTIPNGVFNEKIPEHPTLFAERYEKSICAVGRLARQKGYDVLLTAFSKFAESHKGYTLNIYGDGGEKQKLQQLIAEKSLQNSVILHGNVPDVISKIHNNGMFVMASRFEGMPNALIEAMACGIPCISTDCDFGPGELICSGENGILVPVEDADALAAAMARIADDRVFARKLGENALAIRETHSRDRIFQMYKEAIDV